MNNIMQKITEESFKDELEKIATTSRWAANKLLYSIIKHKTPKTLLDVLGQGLYEGSVRQNIERKITSLPPRLFGLLDPTEKTLANPKRTLQLIKKIRSGKI
jgi:hypothetical protein